MSNFEGPILDPWQQQNGTAGHNESSPFGGSSGNNGSREGMMESFRSKNLRQLSNDYTWIHEAIQEPRIETPEKRSKAQTLLWLASSVGDIDKVKEALDTQLVNLDRKDPNGVTALTYATCFGDSAISDLLLDHGADINQQDSNKWSPLMWAIANDHLDISRSLISRGASITSKSVSGQSALDFVSPDSELESFMKDHGITIPDGDSPKASEVLSDFYNEGMNQERRMQQSMAESEFERRMKLQSDLNLDVDLNGLGLSDRHHIRQGSSETNNLDYPTSFDWNSCKPDQMFVFSENDIGRILELTVINIKPRRSSSEKPIPANVLFLCARFAHYYGNATMLTDFMDSTCITIRETVHSHAQDIAYQAFWLSNISIFIYYLKRDTDMVTHVSSYIAQLSTIMQEIYLMIIGDAMRRMEHVLIPSMLEHETIPGLEKVAFKNQWRLFHSLRKSHSKGGNSPLSIEDACLPPTPEKKAQPSPRLITSLLASVEFVLDLYDVHPIIVNGILRQLLHWLNATLFNRIMSNRSYLARTKAMQVRLNVSAIEDWARATDLLRLEHNGGANTARSKQTESVVAIARSELVPLIQLLQWLQVLTTIGEDFTSLIDAVQQLKSLTPTQLLYTNTHYRPEVGEPLLTSESVTYLRNMERSMQEAASAEAHAGRSGGTYYGGSGPGTPKSDHGSISEDEPKEDSSEGTTKQRRSKGHSSKAPQPVRHSLDAASRGVLLDASDILPLVLPNMPQMLLTWSSSDGRSARRKDKKKSEFDSWGNLQDEGQEDQESSSVLDSSTANGRLYIPFIPSDFVSRLDGAIVKTPSHPLPAHNISGVNRAWQDEDNEYSVGLSGSAADWS